MAKTPVDPDAGLGECFAGNIFGGGHLCAVNNRILVHADGHIFLSRGIHL
jgi:hypothetical protein